MATIPLMFRPTVPVESGEQKANALAQIAGQQLENQQRQQAVAEGDLKLQQERQLLSDQNTFRQALTDNQGDWQKALASVQDKIGLPAYQAIYTQHLMNLKSVAGITKENLDTYKDALDRVSEIHEKTKGLSDEDYQENWPQIAHSVNEVFSSLPPDPSRKRPQMLDPNTPMSRQQFNDAELGLQTQSQYLANEKDRREGQKAEQELTEKQLQTTATTQKNVEDRVKNVASSLANAQTPQQYKSALDFYKKAGYEDDVLNQFDQEYSPEAVARANRVAIGPVEAAKIQQQMPAEKLIMNDYIAKHPGSGPADFKRWEASLAPAARVQIENGLAAAGVGQTASDVAKRFGMTPEAFDQAAEKYYQTGTLPQVGRGISGAALQRAIMNQTAALHPGASLAEGSAEYKANAESLKKIQGNLDAVSAFENTANKNLDLFTNLAQKAIDTGIPLLNAPLRNGAKLLLGSEDQLALDAARQVAVNEIAKVTSSPGLTGQLSDSARHEVEAFIPQSATYGQALRVAQVLKTDMANRHQSYDQQIADIKGRMKTPPAGTAAPAAGGTTQKTNPKSLTAEQIAAYAQQHGVTEEEVKRQARAKGIQVP